MKSDKYKTIKENNIGEGFYSEKRSKFLAFAHHINSTEEALDIVKEYKKKYYDARHCCYAYRLGTQGEEYRMNDDGEPSSTAGKPIYGQLLRYDLTNILICVIRYYGGVNLGIGGLITAYKTAAANAIFNSSLEERYIEEVIDFSFTYPMMNDVMKIIKDMNPRILHQHFDNTCTMRLSIRKSQAKGLKSRLEKLSFK